MPTLTSRVSSTSSGGSPRTQGQRSSDPALLRLHRQGLRDARGHRPERRPPYSFSNTLPYISERMITDTSPRAAGLPDLRLRRHQGRRRDPRTRRRPRHDARRRRARSRPPRRRTPKTAATRGARTSRDAILDLLRDDTPASRLVVERSPCSSAQARGRPSTTAARSGTAGNGRSLLGAVVTATWPLPRLAAPRGRRPRRGGPRRRRQAGQLATDLVGGDDGSGSSAPGRRRRVAALAAPARSPPRDEAHRAGAAGQTADRLLRGSPP